MVTVTTLVRPSEEFGRVEYVKDDEWDEKQKARQDGTMCWVALRRPCAPLQYISGQRSHFDVAVYIVRFDCVFGGFVSCGSAKLVLVSLPEAELGWSSHEDWWYVIVYICGTGILTGI